MIDVYPSEEGASSSSTVAASVAATLESGVGGDGGGGGGSGEQVEQVDDIALKLGKTRIDDEIPGPGMPGLRLRPEVSEHATAGAVQVDPRLTPR